MGKGLRRWVAGVGVGAVLGCVVFALSFPKSSEDKRKSPMIAFLQGSFTGLIVPENISTIPLFHLNANLWDTLLTPDGPGVASLSSVSDDQTRYQFTVRNVAKFSNGRSIKSEDVKFSLDRILALQETGHFSAKSLIKSVVVESENNFSIYLWRPAPSFLYLLSIPELGIVPREACDPGGKVVSLNVTSGAYVVESLSQGSQEVVLKKNGHFSRFVPTAPEVVRVRFVANADDLVELAGKQNVDFIELYDSVGVSVFPLLRKLEGYTYAITKPSYSVFLVADPRSLSVGDRASVRRILDKDLRYQPIADIEQRSFQLLPPRTFGSLDAISMPAMREEDASLRSPRRLNLASFGSKSKLFDEIGASLGRAGYEVRFGNAQNGGDFDLLLIGQGMNADHPEIELFLSLVSSWSVIPVGQRQKDIVSAAAYELDDKKRRDAIREIGSELLSSNVVIPLVLRSYVHFYSKARFGTDSTVNYDGDVLFYRMPIKQ